MASWWFRVAASVWFVGVRVVAECVLYLSVTIMGWRPRRRISKLPAHMSLAAAIFVCGFVFYQCDSFARGMMTFKNTIVGNPSGQANNQPPSFL